MQTRHSIHLTRRRFLAAAGVPILTGCASRRGDPAATLPSAALPVTSPAERLHVAVIGAGGRGQANRERLLAAGCQIVALCDVDAKRLAEAAARHPGAKTYADFRKLLEQKDIDAVCIAAPDHIHAVASMAAMRLGKHVYCEKPLTHSIYEARQLADAARQYKLATQMGQSGHSSNGTRLTVEWIQGGVIGTVKEVHAWTNRPIWPQGIARPTDAPAVPPELNWDLWLGPAPQRPYHGAYAHFKWRGWYDFGTGALGDMGIHILNAAYWTLDLRGPFAVSAQVSEQNAETWPKSSAITWEFPARGARAAVKVIWYDGGRMPARPEELHKDLPFGTPDGGCLFVGDKGKLLLGHGHEPRLLPDALAKEAKLPEPTIPRSPGHWMEWAAAARGGAPSSANFDYSGPFTEMILAGNLSIRAKKKLDWDPSILKATNAPEADAFIRREYRAGWGVE